MLEQLARCYYFPGLKQAGISLLFCSAISNSSIIQTFKKYHWNPINTKTSLTSLGIGLCMLGLIKCQLK